MSQEELAFPIMDRASLSRIENGRVTPSKQHLEALLEKLGLHASSVANFYLNKELTEIQKIQNELNSLLANQIMDENDPVIAKIDDLISQLENHETFMQNSLDMQRLLTDKATNAVNKKENPEEILEILTKSIKITIPDYDVKKIKDYFLSNQDVRILNLFAVVNNIIGNFAEGIDILYGLKANLENHCIDATAMGRTYPSLTYNLSSNLQRIRRYKEALDVCIDGQKVCLNTYSLIYMPQLVLVESVCHFYLGNPEESKMLAVQAYHAATMFKQDYIVQTLISFAKDKLEMDF